MTHRSCVKLQARSKRSRMRSDMRDQPFPRTTVPHIAALMRVTLALVGRSEMRLVRVREGCGVVVMERKAVFGADGFRPLVAVAQVDHDRGPGGGEGAGVLDRELDLQVFVLVVRVVGSAGAP